MPDTKKCNKCNGSGFYEALISMYDDKTEIVICEKCHGKGIIYTMTEEEEQDYYENYW
jgi:DnaJ-class molecular chaperone